MSKFGNPVPNCWNTTNKTHLTYDATIAMVVDATGETHTRHLPREQKERDFIVRALARKGEVSITNCTICQDKKTREV